MPDEPKELTDPLEPTDEDEDEVDPDAAAVEDGEICAICGEEFIVQQEKAAICPSCWKDASAEERGSYAESTSDIVRG